MKKGTGIIIITAVFALLLWAGCGAREDEVIDITVTAPSGTAAPEEKVQPETAEEAPEAGESNQSPAQADEVRGLWERIYGYWNGGDQRYAAFTVNKKGLLQFSGNIKLPSERKGCFNRISDPSGIISRRCRKRPLLLSL